MSPTPDMMPPIAPPVRMPLNAPPIAPTLSNASWLFSPICLKSSRRFFGALESSISLISALKSAIFCSARPISFFSFAWAVSASSRRSAHFFASVEFFPMTRSEFSNASRIFSTFCSATMCLSLRFSIFAASLSASVAESPICSFWRLKVLFSVLISSFISLMDALKSAFVAVYWISISLFLLAIS